MSEENYWKKNAESHAKDVFRMMALYFRGLVPMESVETSLKKLVADSALYTQQSVEVKMDEVKELIINLRITIPDKFLKFPKEAEAGKAI